MDVEFDWDGLDPDGLAEQFRDLGGELHSELSSAADDIGVRIRSTAQRLAPVDTTRMRDSIEHVVETIAESHLRVVVGTNVEYGKYQEFGTAVMAAQPYLRPALEQERDWVIGRIERAVEKAARNAGFDV